MRLEIEKKVVDSMQIEMSNAAKKKLLSINLQTVPQRLTVTEKKGLEWSKRSGNWCWSRCNWRDY
jgi:hypothetical protein